MTIFQSIPKNPGFLPVIFSLLLILTSQGFLKAGGMMEEAPLSRISYGFAGLVRSHEPKDKNILLVVGNVKELNRSERMLMARLKEQGYPVMLVNDQNNDHELTQDISLVIVSKTVNSLNVGTRFKDVSCGFMTWEDNLQMAQLMGYSENDGAEGTAWHVKGQRWYVLPDGPDALNAGLSGELDIYTEPDEITYSPNDSRVPESAIVLAELYSGDYHKTYYVFEEGAVLGDGSKATGRRIYFGLYDDTFRLLTEAGLTLFDAAILWGTER